MLSEIFQAAAQAVPYIAGGIGLIMAYKLLRSSIFTCAEKHKALITTFGKFSREADAGLGFKWPSPIQHVAAEVPMALQQFQDNLKTRTKDDMILTLPITVHYEVFDARRYHFNANKPEEQMAKIVAATVKDQGSSMTSEDFFAKRSEISDAVIKAVTEEMKDYGVSVKRVMIDQPKFPEEVETSYANVKASEKNLLAANNKAEAVRITMVKEAEGRKEAAKLYGEGIAAQRAAVSNGLLEQIRSLTGDDKATFPLDSAVAALIVTSDQDTLRDIGHKGNLIVAPSDAASAIGKFQTLRQTVKGAPVLAAA